MLPKSQRPRLHWMPSLVQHLTQPYCFRDGPHQSRRSRREFRCYHLGPRRFRNYCVLQHCRQLCIGLVGHAEMHICFTIVFLFLGEGGAVLLGPRPRLPSFGDRSLPGASGSRSAWRWVRPRPPPTPGLAVALAAAAGQRWAASFAQFPPPGGASSFGRCSYPPKLLSGQMLTWAAGRPA